MTTNIQPSALQLAKQGNPKAIVTLISQKLKTKGITVKASLQEDCLRLLFLSDPTPDRAQLVAWVENSFKSLHPTSISQVQLYGKNFTSNLPEWQHLIQLNPVEDDLDVFADASLSFQDYSSTTSQNHSSLNQSKSRVSHKGTVLDFSIQKNEGIISGDNGERFTFSGTEWNLQNSPAKGIRIDFEADGSHACSIYEDLSAPTYSNRTSKSSSKKSKSTACILALLLGGIGIHYFYLGSWGWGLLSMIFFWTYIPALIAFITAIRYLIMADEEFEKRASRISSPFDCV